jgi:HNH endonuclease
MKTLAERFEEKVDRDGPVPEHRPELGPCWVWTAAKNDRGYGQIRGEGRLEYAHRAAFFLAHGRWPEPFGCHHCDNPACVRPSHLFEGTRADNARDMSRKGRSLPQAHPERLKRGSQHGCAKLVESDIHVMRAALAAGESKRSIARRYGVHRATIQRIAHGKIWRHVDATAPADLRGALDEIEQFVAATN